MKEIQSVDNSSENLNSAGNVDEEVVEYFDCKICSSTVSVMKGQENQDPNLQSSVICKNCKTRATFLNSLPENINESLLLHKETGNGTYVTQEATSDEANTSSEANNSTLLMSPLTTRTPNSLKTSSTSSSSNSSRGIVRDGLVDDDIFSVGFTHVVAVAAKAPKNTSNYGVMNLYQSVGVLDSELELQLKDGRANEKRLDKFYAGVDVIYKTEKKVHSCVPLLCPAKVYYDDASSGASQCEVMVGIIHDGHNSTVPVVAVYDSFHQFKNLAKSRTVAHNLFSKYQPTSIAHDFSPEELMFFSKELFSFLNVKSALEEKEGLFYNILYV